LGTARDVFGFLLQLRHKRTLRHADQQMANEQLKQALRTNGLEIDDLAEQVGVDVKTAQRWLSGRTPYPRYRRRVADALNTTERTLWPDEVPEFDSGSEPVEREMLGVLGAGDGPDWRELATGARDRVELLDLTLADIISDDADAQLLADAAGRGCRVRVLISHPDSIHLAIAEEQAGRYLALAERPAAAAELERVGGLLTSHVGQQGVELRTFVGAGSYRVLIIDDQAIVRLRLPGVPPEWEPVLRIDRERNPEVLDGFAFHFDAMWQTSEPWS
jgi:lambda repressor-like predicted transcriptional regulator